MRRALLLAAALVLISGCGVPQQLSKQAEEVHSVAAEGALLAHEASEGSLDTFTREHAKALRKLLGAASAGDRGRPARSRPRTQWTQRSPTSPSTPATGRRASRLERRLDDAGEGRRRARGMKNIFGVALGILAAIGGFVDIGDIVFNVAAGATFGYQLLWAVVLGVGGIITYAEMCGRVAAVSETAVFDAVRERLGFSVGLVALLAGELVNLLTLAAEIGGVAIALQLLSGLSYRALLVLAVLALGLVLWLMPFQWIERDLRLLRPRAARLRRRGVQAPSGLGRGRARLRPVDRKRERLGLRLLRRRPRRRGDDPVRGLLLLVGCDRGAVGAEGSRAQPRERADRLLARRPALLRAHDLGRRVAAAEGNQRRAAGDGGARRPGAARPGGSDSRARRHPLRGVRRRDRLRFRRRLQRRAVLRLGVGQVPPQRRRAALHARLDGDARARHS